MKVNLTQSRVAEIKATGKAFWVTDAGFRNLRLYVAASGNKTFYVGYQDTDGRNKSHKLGSTEAFTVTEARNMAGVFLTALARGEAPVKKNVKKLLLGEFIEEHYGPWVVDKRKVGKETMATLRSIFQFLFTKPIDELNIAELENWRTNRQKEGKKASTINRHVTALRAALNWGVDHELMVVCQNA